MNKIAAAERIADKMERCHKAVKGILEESDWQDNFSQWKTMIDAHQRRHPGANIMESVIFLTNSLQGHYYSVMVLLAVAYEILSNEDQHVN